MCGGPSSAQTQNLQMQTQFYQKQMDAYDKAYANFQQIQAAVKGQIDPILQAGAGQYGYTTAEDTALRTQAGEGTAQGFAAAQRALQQRLAAQGGGTSNVNITSGGSRDLQATLAAQTAAEQSRENLGITTSGYDIGRQMWTQAVNTEEGLAQSWNPNTFAGTAISAGSSAASEANTIAAQQNQMWGSILGALGGVAGSAAGGWAMKGMPKFGGGSGGGSSLPAGGLPMGGAYA